MSVIPFVYEILEAPGAWTALEREWRELFDAAKSPSSTLRWEWLNQWWKIFGPVYGAPPGGLKVIAVRKDGKLAAALPLYLQQTGNFSRRRLGFLGSGESANEAVYPEKLDILHAPLSDSELKQVSLAFAEALTRLEWHEWDLGIASESSLLLQVLGMLPSSSAKRMRRSYPAPYADLNGGFEAYLERQSSNSRQQFRRILRSVPKANLSFEIASEESQALRFLEQLIDLHQKRWEGSGQPGAFQSERVREFHRGLVKELLPAGKVVLARLGTKDEAAAVLYGFIAGAEFDFYQSGLVRDAFGELKSPGIAAHLLLMQHLSQHGITTYDFLAGASSYKDKLATGTRALVRIRLLKLTFGNAVHLVQEIGMRLSKRFTRSEQSAELQEKHA